MIGNDARACGQGEMQHRKKWSSHFHRRGSVAFIAIKLTTGAGRPSLRQSNRRQVSSDNRVVSQCPDSALDENEKQGLAVPSKVGRVGASLVAYCGVPAAVSRGRHVWTSWTGHV